VARTTAAGGGATPEFTRFGAPVLGLAHRRAEEVEWVSASMKARSTWRCRAGNVVCRGEAQLDSAELTLARNSGHEGARKRGEKGLRRPKP